MPSTTDTSIVALGADTATQIQSAFEVPSLLALVQELVKNSVDAGATKITVQISAKNFDNITTIDNGSGISEDGLKLVARRGCTSKSGHVNMGNSLAAIAATSARLKICTRTLESAAASQLEINSAGEIVDRSHVARNQGTTITVVQPLCKLPVRYNLAKAQSTRIKAGIRCWLATYCLANYTLAISLVHVGMARGMRDSKSIVSFPGALSLEDAVVRFIGSTRSNSVLHIEYPDKHTSGAALVTNAQLKGVSFEGVFLRINCAVEAFEVRNLPRLSLSINGVPCKADSLPGLTEQLQETYSADTVTARQNSGLFLGVLKVTVSQSKLDASSKEPWLLHRFDAETIASEVAQSIVVANTRVQTPQPRFSLQQWSRGQCDIGTPTALHCPALKRKMPEQRSTAKPRKHPRDQTVEVDTIKSPEPQQAEIPTAIWAISSVSTSGLFADGSTGEVVCLVLDNGSVCLPDSRTEAYADPLAHCLLCIVCASDMLIAVDTRNLCLESLLTASGSIQLQSLQPCACILQDQLD